MDSRNFTHIGNNSHTDSASGYAVRFWAYLFADIFSLMFGLFDIYHLLIDAALRRALHNHVIIVLLFICIFYELTNIPWILYNDYNRSPLVRSEIFYFFWTYINYSFYSLQVELFAWATIERHILIFHDHWISTKRRRFFIHYFPVIAIIVYYLIYFAFVHFYPFCKSTFDAFLAGGIHIPCVFHRTTLGMWDLMFHQVVPTLVIVTFSIALIVRSILQRNKLCHAIQWKRYRKMIIQLLSISSIYIAFNGPWVLVIFTFQYGLPESIAIVALVYTGFLYYYVVFIFPIVCCLSLPELRKKATELICCRRVKPKDVSDMTSTTRWILLY
jgi:hypothetical protein